jgi:ribonuclease BN (tRNA processing enzyme)
MLRFASHEVIHEGDEQTASNRSCLCHRLAGGILTVSSFSSVRPKRHPLPTPKSYYSAPEHQVQIQNAPVPRRLVISGDAAPSQSIVDSCKGCDVLIHEAYSMMTYNAVSPAYQEYRRKHHTSSRGWRRLRRRHVLAS